MSEIIEGLLLSGKFFSMIRGWRCNNFCPGIIFVKFIKDGERLAAKLTEELGCYIPLISSKTPESKKKEIAEHMVSSKDIPLVVATSTWSTGINIPTLKWVIRTADGMAVIPQEQEAGRGSRVATGKTGFIVFDVTGPDSFARMTQRDRIWRERSYTGPSPGEQKRPPHEDALMQELLDACKEPLPKKGFDEFSIATMPELDAARVKPNYLRDWIIYFIIALILFVILKSCE